MSKQTVAAIGERALIDLVTALLPTTSAIALGPGDDAAIVRSDGFVVVSTDVLVERTHFRLDWSSATDIGTRAAAANLSDIAAMGATPTALVVALVLPPATYVEWVLELATAIAHEATKAGAAVVGGDIAAGDAVCVSVTAIGTLGQRQAVTRSGARAGDVLAVAGRLGWAAAGLTVLSRGFRSPRVLEFAPIGGRARDRRHHIWLRCRSFAHLQCAALLRLASCAPPPAHCPTTYWRELLIDAHRRPQPPYACGRAAAGAGASALIDVSDGLVADVGHIARASGVAIDIDSARLVIDQPLRDAAAAFGVDPMMWLLTGGDDHAFVATFPPEAVMPDGFIAIGSVSDIDASGPQVTVDGQTWQGSAGFDHFS